MPQKLLRLPKRKITTKSAGTSSTRARFLSNKLNDHSSPYMSLVREDSKKAQLLDPFASLYSGTLDISVIEPRLDFTKLVAIGRQNSALNQCIDAYVVNIESYGYQLQYTGPAGKEDKQAAQQQKSTALTFLDNINGDKSLRKIREDTRRDKEYTGNCFFEIGRDLAGRIDFIDHVPAITMRKTRKDKDKISYTTPVMTPEGKVTQRRWQKNFCRFMQLSATGEKIYFKEFGDPRSIDPTTGKEKLGLPIEDQATEIYHDGLYSPGEAYGVPRWLGAIPSMLGLRESELVNLNFFRENAIPAMALLISGGALTEESYDKVSALFNNSRGRDAMNKVLILEAAADDSLGNADQAPPVPRIEMKPMVSERQSDGLFKDFEQEAKTKIRSSMRLPAIYTGDTQEYTKATAQSAQRIGESQVFYPERSLFDEFINRWVLPTLGITLWRFKPMGPTTYDPDSLGTLIDRFARHGAITPNILVRIANQVLDVQIPTPTGKWADVPFNYAMSMVGAGAQLEDFEDTFSLISDATAPTTDNTGANPENEPSDPANPAPAGNNSKAFARILRAELHAISNEIINHVNEKIDTLAEQQ